MNLKKQGNLWLVNYFIYSMESNMDNKQSNSTNDSKKSYKTKNSYRESNSDYNETLDKINYDYDWNTEYGDGDIPDVDMP